MGRPNKKYINTTVCVKVSGVAEETKELLDNIAANMNEDLSKVLRPVLKQFIESQPDNMKRKPLSY